MFNQYLPEDIAALSVKEAGERFHSRFSAIGKIYRYRIHTGKIPEVFERKYVYSYNRPLDVERMKEAAEHMIGTKDFAAFCGNRHMKKSTVRSVSEIRFQETEEELQIIYNGNGFLQNMVRILAGTLTEVGQGKRGWEEMEKILAAKNRAAAGMTAPAQGLCLETVDYDPPFLPPAGTPCRNFW